MLILLLIMSIIVNIFLATYIMNLKNYCKNIFSKIEENSINTKKEYQIINRGLEFISNNMDRHFDGVAGKVNMISTVLNTADKGKKK